MPARRNRGGVSEFWVTAAVIVNSKVTARVRTVRNTNTAYRDNCCELSSEYETQTGFSNRDLGMAV